MAEAQGIVGRRLGDRLILVAVIVLAFLWLVPVFWVLGLSIKPNSELMRSTNTVFQAPYTLKNYSDIIANSGVFRWIINSLIVSVGVTIGTLILASLAGYGFARTKFPGQAILLAIVLIGLAVPEQAVIIARHQMFAQWKMH